MRFRIFRIVTPVFCAATAVFGGCSTAQSGDFAGHPSGTARSWMAPDAQKQPSLLYVSNAGTADVTVYTYLNGGGLLLVGTLSGFSAPRGMCTDRSGDVWITDAGARRVYEFAHGGTTPIDTIREAGNTQPVDCAVDAATGNLAVANQFPNAHYYETGNVKVYRKGSHDGTKYAMGYMEVDFLAYDDRSNLFVDGLPTSPYGYGDNGPLVVIQKGGSGPIDLTVKGGTLEEPRAVQWLKPALLVGDRRAKDSFAYKLFVSGNVATVIAKVQFSQTSETYGFWRRAGKVIVPDYAGNTVRIYTLPDGKLFSSVSDGLSYPFGAVVSQPG